MATPSSLQRAEKLFDRALLIGLGLSGILIVVFMASLLLGFDGTVHTSALQIAAATIACFGCCLWLKSLAKNKQVPTFVLIGVASTLIAWSLWISLFLRDDPDSISMSLDVRAFRIACHASVLSATMLAVGLLCALRWRIHFWTWVCRLLLVGLVFVASGTHAKIEFSFWIQSLFPIPDETLELIHKYIVLGWLIVVAAIITLPFESSRQRRRQSLQRSTLSSDVTITIKCPECAHEHAFETGVHHCPGCNVKLSVEIEESRCECGYLLFHLRANTCPECGRDVDKQMCWTGAMDAPLSDSGSAAAGDL